MLANFLWVLSKPDIRIVFPRRFVEGRGKGDGWAFVLDVGVDKGVGGMYEEGCRRVDLG